MITRLTTGGKRDFQRQLVAEQILGFGVAARLDMLCIIVAVMAHHHGRWMVEPLDQQAGFVPDRKRERPQRPRHPLSAKPALGRIEQRGCNVGVVDQLETAPLPGARSHIFEHEIVHLPRNAADDLAVPLGQKEPRARVLEPRILFGIEQFGRVAAQRRRGVGIVPINIIGEIDEAAQIARSLDRANGERAQPSRASGRRGPDETIPPEACFTHG